MPGISASFTQSDARKIRGGEFPTIPDGIMALWIGDRNQIPSGWFLCDGNNGTPDLNGKYIDVVDSNTSTGSVSGDNYINSSGHSHTLSKPGNDETESGSDSYYPWSTTTDSVSYSFDNRPRTVDYIFIQSDGTGEFESKVGALTDQDDNQYTKRASHHNGNSITPNAENRTLRGTTYGSGSTFGSDSVSQNNSHDHDINTKGLVDGGDGSVVDQANDYTDNTSDSTSHTTNPQAVHYYCTSLILRWGWPNKTDIEGMYFFYVGNVSNLPSGWDVVNNNDEFVRHPNNSSDVGGSYGNISYDSSSSHNHYLNKRSNNTPDWYFPGGPLSPNQNSSTDSDSFPSETRPPHYKVHMIKLTTL